MNYQQTVANSYQYNEILDDFYFLLNDSKVQIIYDKPYITLFSFKKIHAWHLAIRIFHNLLPSPNIFTQWF